MTETLALILYAIAACLWAGAVVVQIKFLSEAGLPLQALMLTPWKALPVLANFAKVFAAPGQIKRFALFALLLFSGAVALVAGRSIELGHPPLLSRSVR